MPLLYPIPIYYIWDNFLNDKNPTFELVKKSVEENLQVLFDPSFPGGDKSLFRMGIDENEIIKVDKEEFFCKLKNLIEENEVITRKSFLFGIYIAFNQCYNKNLENIKYLCFPLHDQPKKHAEYLQEDFEIIKVIHIVRDPVKTIGSSIKHISSVQQKFSLFKSLIYCGVSNIILEKREHWEEKNYKVHGKTPYFNDDEITETRYIKLEDLHINNKDTLGKIINWLSIKDHRSLYQSTFMGLIWHNRDESLKATGASKKIINQKQDLYLNNFDRYRLKLLCRVELEYFKYYKFNKLDIINLIFFMPLLILIPFKCDFNKTRIIYRIKAIMRFYSNKKFPIHLNKFPKSNIFIDHVTALIELIIFNSTSNLIPENELSRVDSFNFTKPIDKFIFFLVMPFYLIRIIINYFQFRLVFFKIYFRNIFFKKLINIKYVHKL